MIPLTESIALLMAAAIQAAQDRREWDLLAYSHGICGPHCSYCQPRLTILKTRPPSKDRKSGKGIRLRLNWDAVRSGRRRT